MALGSGWLNNLQGVYHQVNFADGGRTYDTNRRGANPYNPAAYKAPAATTKKTPGLGAVDAGAGVNNSGAISALNAQLAALQRQLAYQPKLANFDVQGNYRRAQSQAEASVNPLYTKYLNDFLAQNQVKRTARQNETANTREGIKLELQNALAESAVNRTRTEEDTNSAIQRLNEQEGQFQQDSGTQFDRDRRALAEQTAGSGLTTSGIGQFQILDAQNQRNLDEGRQVQEYNNQREAKNLFKTRTFEDLARGDDQSNKVAANKDQAAVFDLDSYLAELAGDETNFRTQNELDRLAAVASQTQTYAQQGTQSFLSSLAGAGYRPQDIALAYQVYG